MTSKSNYGLIIVAMVAVIGLASAPTMQSAFTTTTYYTSFTNSETCLHEFPTSLNSATANRDGDLTVSADTDVKNKYGQATAFTYSTVYLTKNTKVTLLATGTVDLESNGGATNAIAYLAKPGTIYNNAKSGCVSNGAAVTGSIVNLGSATTGQSVDGFKSGHTSFTIPKSETYSVVIYVDANTNKNGEVTSSVTDPLIALYK